MSHRSANLSGQPETAFPSLSFTQTKTPARRDPCRNRTQPWTWVKVDLRDPGLEIIQFWTND